MDMDSKRVEKLITKALLKEISEGEQCELDEWLDASEQNRSFFESLHSEAYLKKAVGDHNRALRDAGWKQDSLAGISYRGGDYFPICVGRIYLVYDGFCGEVVGIAFRISRNKGGGI